jgi:hypothetical protein
MIRVQGCRLPVDLPVTLMPCSCGRGELHWDGARAWRCDSLRGCRKPAIALPALFDEHDLSYKLQLGFHPRNLELSTFAIDNLYTGLIVVEWLTRNEIERLYAGIPTREERDEERVVLNWLMRQGPKVEIPNWVIPDDEA